MDRNESNGAAQEDLEEISIEPIRAPQLSGRMKHLLFGVRLSAAIEPLAPANDLERLAGEIDGLRHRRGKGRDGHSR